jgi:quercetin dioxygenase-like cupin family protein
MSGRPSFLKPGALGLILTLSAFSAHAAEAPLRLTPAQIAALAGGGAGAGSSGVAGIQTTVLSGDPTKAGPYTIQIQVPAHTRIKAHGHRDDRSAVVVAGTWYFGYGDVADDAKVEALPPGGFYTEPAGLAHFAQTRDTGAIVYITGVGPTDTVYVDAANTPGR